MALVFALLAPLMITALLLGSGGASAAAAQTTPTTSNTSDSTAPGGAAVDPRVPVRGLSAFDDHHDHADGGDWHEWQPDDGQRHDHQREQGDRLRPSLRLATRRRALGCHGDRGRDRYPEPTGRGRGQNWVNLSADPAAKDQRDLAAGASMRYVATVAINDRDGLAIGQIGVYPLMIKISGDIGQNGATRYERVGEIHLLATVLSIPPDTPIATGGPITNRGLPSAITPPVGAGTQTAGAVASTGGGATGTESAAGTTDIPTQGLPHTAGSSTGSSPLSGAPGRPRPPSRQRRPPDRRPRRQRAVRQPHRVKRPGRTRRSRPIPSH